MANPPLRRVSLEELRTLFTQHYASRIAAGELQAVLEKEGHPAPGRSGQPVCTLSQYISYRDDNGTRLVEVHRYLRPDGRLGGSGQPDPKYLLLNDVIYKAS